VERAIVRLRNKVGRSDLDYTVQVSISSTDPTVLSYAAQMTAPANGLAPVTFIEKTPEELIKKIREATKHINYDEIEKAYHKAQIEACHRTIQGHQDRITELDPPAPVEEAKEEKPAEPTPVED
jgi:hypothetical protein